MDYLVTALSTYLVVIGIRGFQLGKIYIGRATANLLMVSGGKAKFYSACFIFLGLFLFFVGYLPNFNNDHLILSFVVSIITIFLTLKSESWLIIPRL